MSDGDTPDQVISRRQQPPGDPRIDPAAAQLYLSAATVEAHLSRAYAKLGVGSRTHLARALSPRGKFRGLPGRQPRCGDTGR